MRYCLRYLIPTALALCLVDFPVSSLASAEPAVDSTIASCISIPRNAPNPPVSACETHDTYSITVVGQEWLYPKDEFRRKLRLRLWEWLEGDGGVDSSLLQDAVVEFWLAVPEANPQATQARAHVFSPRTGLRFVAFLELHPETWRIESTNVGVLVADQVYPDSYGYRAGGLLLKANDAVEEEALSAYLSRFGAKLVETFGNGWWEVRVRAFDEERVLDAITNDALAPRYVANLAFDQMIEWIAQREGVFSFPL